MNPNTVEIPATPQLIYDHCIDSRGKRFNIGDEVAYPQTGTIYAYSSQKFGKITNIKFYAHSNKIDLIKVFFQGHKFSRTPRQILKLEQ